MEQLTDADLRERVVRSMVALLPRVLKRELPDLPEQARLFDELGLSSASTLELLVLAAVPDGRPVDLLVLAFAIHDVRLGRATALYLSGVCPGEPMAFAVCDQGAAGAFTALRLVGEYARTAGCRRCLLLVVEQSALHYRPAGPAPVPE